MRAWIAAVVVGLVVTVGPVRAQGGQDICIPDYEMCWGSTCSDVDFPDLGNAAWAITVEQCFDTNDFSYWYYWIWDGCCANG